MSLGICVHDSFPLRTGVRFATNRRGEKGQRKVSLNFCIKALLGLRLFSLWLLISVTFNLSTQKSPILTSRTYFRPYSVSHIRISVSDAMISALDERKGNVYSYPLIDWRIRCIPSPLHVEKWHHSKYEQHAHLCPYLVQRERQRHLKKCLVSFLFSSRTPPSSSPSLQQAAWSMVARLAFLVPNSKNMAFYLLIKTQ